MIKLSSVRTFLPAMIAALLIFLFIYTASNKLFEIHAFRTVLTKSELIGKNSAWLSWSIPVIEVIISFLLIVPRFRSYGLLFSAVLMLTFTLYVGYMILFAAKLPCSCGGIISKLTWPQHLLFNFLFTAISVAGYILLKKERKFSIAIDQDKPNTCII